MMILLRIPNIAHPLKKLARSYLPICTRGLHSLEENQVIRKCGQSERNKFVTEDAKYLSKTIRFTTKMDLYSNIGIVNKSIRQWMRIHPFLRTNIAKINDDYFFVFNKELLESSKLIDSQNEDDLANVKYLFLQNSLSEPSGKRDFFQTVVDLLADRDIRNCDEIDVYNQLLWNMKFFTMNRKTKQESFEFEIILLLHHAITDGLCCHFNFLQLLEIIEKNYKRNINEHSILLKDVMPSREELFIDNYANKHKKLDPLPAVYMPPFILKNQSNEIKASLDKSLDLPNQYLYSINSKGDVEKDSCLDELKNIQMNSHIVNKYFLLDEITTKNLIKKCKSNNCKLSACLNMVMCFTFSKLFKENNYVSRSETSGLNSDNSSYIKYFNSVSFRNKKTNGHSKYDSIDVATMGYCTTNIARGIYLPEYQSDEAFSHDEFWSLARKDGNKLHEFINSGDIFLRTDLRKKDPREINSHFLLTNLTVLPTRLRDDQESSFETCVTDIRTKSFLSKVHLHSLIHVGTATMNNQLNALFYYNSNFIDQKSVDKIIEYFFDFIKKVSSD